MFFFERGWAHMVRTEWKPYGYPVICSGVLPHSRNIHPIIFITIRCGVSHRTTQSRWPLACLWPSCCFVPPRSLLTLPSFAPSSPSLRLCASEHIRSYCETDPWTSLQCPTTHRDWNPQPPGSGPIAMYHDLPLRPMHLALLKVQLAFQHFLPRLPQSHLPLGQPSTGLLPPVPPPWWPTLAPRWRIP